MHRIIVASRIWSVFKPAAGVISAVETRSVGRVDAVSTLDQSPKWSQSAFWRPRPAFVGDALDPADPVFFVDDAVEGMDLGPFERLYSPLGEHPFPPRATGEWNLVCAAFNLKTIWRAAAA